MRSSGVLNHFREITAGVSLVDGAPCDAINAAADCTITGIDANGKTTPTLTLTKGWNYISLRRVDTVSGGTALVAGYMRY